MQQKWQQLLRMIMDSLWHFFRIKLINIYNKIKINILNIIKQK